MRPTGQKVPTPNQMAHSADESREGTSLGVKDLGIERVWNQRVWKVNEIGSEGAGK